MVELDQLFEHVAGASELGAVEVSTDGMTWATVATYTAGAQGHASIDISAAAAGKPSFAVRFRFDDQTSVASDPYGGGWYLDNVHVYGF